VRPAVALVAAILAMAASGTAEADESGPRIDFLDVEAAKAAIADESLEPYFSLLEPLEMAAKTGKPLEAKDLKAQREECRTRYQQGVRAFTDEEKTALTSAVRRLHAAWADPYPRIADLPWSFLGVENTVEGGLPHTRGRSIVVPRSVGVAIAAAETIGGAAARRNVELLVHEQSHVLQRLEPALFEPLYTGDFGFVRAQEVALHRLIAPRHVVNPDGVRVEWVFPRKEGEVTTYLHPLVAFAEGAESPRMPYDMAVLAVEVVKSERGFEPKEDSEGRPLARPLGSIRDYGERFGGIFENFHPNEIFAVLFATLVLQDHFEGRGLPRPSAAAGKDWAKLRPWCREAFAAKAAATTK
jgi:hypothetical protein